MIFSCFSFSSNFTRDLLLLLLLHEFYCRGKNKKQVRVRIEAHPVWKDTKDRVYCPLALQGETVNSAARYAPMQTDDGKDTTNKHTHRRTTTKKYQKITNSKMHEFWNFILWLFRCDRRFKTHVRSRFVAEVDWANETTRHEVFAETVGRRVLRLASAVVVSLSFGCLKASGACANATTTAKHKPKETSIELLEAQEQESSALDSGIPCQQLDLHNCAFQLPLLVSIFDNQTSYLYRFSTTQL